MPATVAAAPALDFEYVTFHAKGAWPYRTGEMTHSANGLAFLASGETVSFDVSRYYVKGEGTSYSVALYSAARRELTAAKWDALKAAVRKAFVAHVRTMADGPRPASIKPGRVPAADPVAAAVETRGPDFAAAVSEFGADVAADVLTVEADAADAAPARCIPAIAYPLGTDAPAGDDAAPTLALAALTPDAARLAVVTLDNPPAIDRGGVQRGADGRQFIDLTPTWSAMLRTMLHVYDNADGPGRAIVVGEMEKMAALADRYVNARAAFANLAGGH